MITVKSKVFVSCGQHSESERAVAHDIRLLLEGLGFAVYVAVDVQTVLEINQRIIGELKNSDYYLFVNFCRDLIGGRFRGSLFSNQEFAIAYALGFEQLLVINQEGIAPEGMLRYIGVNTETFKTHEQCVPTVARALERAGWTPDYARRLVAGGLRFSDCPMRYGTLCGRFLYLDVHNHRADVAALEATGRLVSLMPTGGQRAASPIRSPLKATGRPGFSHTIFPKSHEAFDLLCIGWDVIPRPDDRPGAGVANGEYMVREDGAEKVYLTCALDVFPLPALPMTAGAWNLRFEFFAISFPVLCVDVEVQYGPDRDPYASIVGQDLRE